MAFYVSTWEEYNTGILFLGYFSGPVEGQLILIALLLIVPFVNPSLWTANVAASIGHELAFNTAAVVLVSVGVFITILGSLYNVYRTRGLAPMKQLLPFSLFMFVVVYVFAVDSNLRRWTCLLLYVCVFGLAFASSVLGIITAHLTKNTFPIWTLCYFPILLAFFLVGLFKLQVNKSLWPLIVSLLFNSAVYALQAHLTIGQICSNLRINCLRIKTTTK